MADHKKHPAKPDVIGETLSKLAALPAGLDLAIAFPLAAYAAYVLHVGGGPKYIGFMGLLAAFVFAGLGINSVLRSMRSLKLMERYAKAGGIVVLDESTFEKVLQAYYSTRGYFVEEAKGDPSDRAYDLIASQKKERLLLRTRDWVEDKVPLDAVRRLHGAKRLSKATGSVIFTAGRFEKDALEWGQKQGVDMVVGEKIESEIIAAAGGVAASPTPEGTAKASASADSAQVVLKEDIPVIIFLDIVAIEKGAPKLCAFLESNPGWKLVATTGKDKSQDELDALLSGCGDRLIGKTTNLPQFGTTARYFEILGYLAQSPGGPGAHWVALDTEPAAFPEGCIELLPVSRGIGVTDETLAELEKRLKQMQ